MLPEIMGGVMARYTVRVELHNADTYNDYENLHKAMERQGFIRTIKDTNDVEWHLPDAEYNRQTAGDKNAVLNKVRAIVAAVGFPVRKEQHSANDRTSSILVTESAGRVWDGLLKA